MSHAGRRTRRLLFGSRFAAAAQSARAQSVALTTVSDIVYRADGNPAAGTVLISWPGFTTGDAHAVAAGNKNVILGSGGSFTVQLAPNAGATPPGVVYTVVYQLSDATVKTENWSVERVRPKALRRCGPYSVPRVRPGSSRPSSSLLPRLRMWCT
jgi:hypothetical protein